MSDQLYMACRSPAILPVPTIVDLLKEQTDLETGMSGLAAAEQGRRKRRIQRIIGLLRADALARQERQRTQPRPTVAEHTPTSCGVRRRAATAEEVARLQGAVLKNERELIDLRNQAEAAGLKVKPRAELGPLFMPVRNVWA